MRRFATAVLLACLRSTPVFSGTADSPSDASSMENMFRQMTQAWEDATQAHDVDKVGQIEAEDWRSVAHNGEVDTRESDLDGLKSGTAQHVHAQLGPMDVKMLGDDVAVVQGTLTAMSVPGADNANAGSVYDYMDVWFRRGGKWMVVRSLDTKVK